MGLELLPAAKPGGELTERRELQSYARWRRLNQVASPDVKRTDLDAHGISSHDADRRSPVNP